MKKSISDALKEAEKRLDEMLPEIEKRHSEGVENSADEPANLKSGYTDDLLIRRAIKEQEEDET